MSLARPTLTCLLLGMALHSVALRAQAPDTPRSPHPYRHHLPPLRHVSLLILGQANVIFQAHAPFHSPYSGDNSLLARGEYKTSLVETLYLGAQLIRTPRFNTDFLVDFESAGGRGISEALGLAGFTNLDVVRNPSLGTRPYLARIQLHQTIGLSSTQTNAERTPYSLAIKVPTRRLELRFGKMGIPDVLDLNAVGTDSHLQFMNWTVDNNGAWDYAADTRGYTYAAVAEYDAPRWSARYALALMPTEANGIHLDWNLRRARGENTEFEFRPTLFGPDRKSIIRLLGFVNRANMGLYRNATKAFQSSLTPTLDITVHTPASTVKYGVGLNLEQEITPTLRAYARFGWNEGQHQSYAYTEVDQTFALGADYSMSQHGRPLDKLGLTFVTNAIKRDHQNYLKLGGQGFLLGDGTLRYAREDIVEAYTTSTPGAASSTPSTPSTSPTPATTPTAAPSSWNPSACTSTSNPALDGHSDQNLPLEPPARCAPFLRLRQAGLPLHAADLNSGEQVFDWRRAPHRLSF